MSQVINRILSPEHVWLDSRPDLTIEVRVQIISYLDIVDEAQVALNSFRRLTEDMSVATTIFDKLYHGHLFLLDVEGLFQ